MAESTAARTDGGLAKVRRLLVSMVHAHDASSCRGVGTPISTAATMNGHGWCPYGHTAPAQAGGKTGLYSVIGEHSP